MGVELSKNGMSISSNQQVTEATIEISHPVDLEVFLRMVRWVATCEKAFKRSGPCAPLTLYRKSNTFPTQFSTFRAIFGVFSEFSCSFCNTGYIPTSIIITLELSGDVTVTSKAAEMLLSQLQLVTRMSAGWVLQLS